MGDESHQLSRRRLDQGQIAEIGSYEELMEKDGLFAELARRGWSERDLRKLAGENVLRAWREAEAVSRRLSRERAPSLATIEKLDGAPVSSR